MKFDFTFNWSNMLELAAILLTLWKMHAANTSRIQRIEDRLDLLFVWFQRNVIDRATAHDDSGHVSSELLEIKKMLENRK